MTPIKRTFTLSQEKVRNVIFLIIALCIIWFIASRFSAIARGPSLVSYTLLPDPDTPALISMQGVVKHVARLTINGYPVIPAVDDGFEYTLLAPAGYSLVTIFGEDKFGKTFTKKLSIYTDEPPDQTSIVSPTPSIEETQEEKN